MIALVTITYIALIVLIYKVRKIKPTPVNIAGMALLVVGMYLMGK